MVRLEEVTVIGAPLERCFDLARSVEVHVKGNRHWGEQAVALSGVTSGLVGLGERVTWQARHFGVRQTLISEITAMDAPRFFQDTMIRGAFKSMQHDHHFRTLADGATEMRDVFCFAAPLGVLGRVAEVLLLRQYMTTLLRERNAVVKQVAESNEWRKYLLDAS
ncbi:SRPBCC family protein [Edaphobacter bradus]|uniref:SRPBCC family protein n=1 Tax=Edaphobacter bradus TaxID=2259016 RepID=UPI0021E03C1A|nr:SRPBCC family protein [Edaphobacter bradus]